MHHTTVTLGGVAYFLAAAVAREDVARAALDAIERGGGYVTLDLAGGAQLEVLFSRGMAVLIGTAEIADDAA